MHMRKDAWLRNVCFFICIATFTSAQRSCSNLLYCHTKEFKYGSFSVLNNTYLNVTVLKTTTNLTWQTCTRECILLSECQSVNLYLINETTKENTTGQCELLAGNIMSNHSSMKNKSGCRHYYIKNPCLSSPCRNGGTCIPQYQRGNYTCVCAPNKITVWISGIHCEILTVAEETAYAYYPYDEYDNSGRTKDVNNHGKYAHGIGSNSQIIPAPDRRSKGVAQLLGSGSTGLYSGSGDYSSHCLTTTSCNMMSVSFWAKLTRRQIKKFTGSTNEQWRMVYTSQDSSSDLGFSVLLWDRVQNPLRVYIRQASHLFEINYPIIVNIGLVKKWTHFMFTFENSHGLFLYIDGKQTSNVTSPTSMSTLGSDAHNTLQVGNINPRINMYIDDLIIWHKMLTEDDVEVVYKNGLKKSSNYIP